jgi:hypothetical protein
MYGALYEIIGISIYIITIIGIVKSWKKDRDKANTLMSILLVGLFFGASWEPQGTGPIWSYHGFNLYTYADIPLVIILNWSWCMILCHLISKQVRRIFIPIRSIKDHWIAFKGSFFLSGVLVAFMVEPILVYFGWWQYHYVGDKTVLVFPLLNVRFSLAVIIGWGVLAMINLTLSGKTAESLTIIIERASHFSHSAALAVSSSLIGLLSGWLSWQLIVLFTTLVEDTKPRIFFTGDYIIELEWITSAQLVTILVLTTACAVYIWRRKKVRERSQINAHW